MTLPPPIQVLAPGAVLLTGSAVPAARTFLTLAHRSRRRNGHPESRALIELLEALETAAAPGHSDATQTLAGETEPIEWISTEQVAEQLNCSTRNVRRQAPKLGGQLINGRWQFDSQAIAEHIEGAKTSWPQHDPK
ncbi:hypothetical protein C5142_18240 [Rhodococcus sp. BGS-1C]|uniref:hypothetical protein n=1 Tax=Rhodococcus sp. BGS-1C TaxID=2100132 RepID=UPI003DA1A7B4